MTLQKWTPPAGARPSPTRRGETDKTPIFTVVGQTLSEWEYAEMAMAWIFGALVESDSDAATKAYGTIYGGPGRRDALTFAADEYLKRHPAHTALYAEIERLIQEYTDAWPLRNNIAHGIVMAIVDTRAAPTGWFLQSPDYASKKRDQRDPFYSRYYYNAEDISLISQRVSEIQNEAERLAHLIRQKFARQAPQ